MKIADLNNKKILILGFGEEGIDTLFFLKKKVNYNLIGVADSCSFSDLDIRSKSFLDEKIEKHFGKKYLSSVSNYDVVIKSPGVPLHLLGKNNNQIITSQSDLFLSNCKSKVIGVTGTKGKSTVCLLLCETLKNAGKNVEVIGNIGRPALSYLLNEKDIDYFIYELSSFQLQTVSKSPDIALFLNIFEDHLDKHKSFEEYIESKEKITVFQKENDYFIYNKDNELVRIIAEKTKAKKIPFSFQSSKDAVLKVLELLNISEKFLEKTLVNFKGLPHRTEYIGKHKGVHFYNDSAATIPEATIKAIDTVKNIQTIILGGSEKGASIDHLVEKIKKSEIQNVVIFKGTDKKLQTMIKSSEKIIFLASNMQDAVDYCFKNTDYEKTCLLSPGFASFNMFKNYKDRGEQFKKFVLEYK
jgi:UDP-N-acetylmuramoyl-L-alanine---L-glutamate ligase